MRNVETGVTDDPREVTIDRSEATPHLPEGGGMTVETVAPDELEADESTPGVVRATVFETGENVMVRSRVAPGTTTAWHHHGDRHVCGYVVEGSGTVEYGAGGQETAETSAGEFFYISPGTVHRDVNPTSEDTVVLVNFVGTGPAVVNVGGPGAE
jgi:quercetin dioxygenase-like cupin family protein